MGYDDCFKRIRYVRVDRYLKVLAYHGPVLQAEREALSLEMQKRLQSADELHVRGIDPILAQSILALEWRQNLTAGR